MLTDVLLNDGYKKTGNNYEKKYDEGTIVFIDNGGMVMPIFRPLSMPNGFVPSDFDVSAGIHGVGISDENMLQDFLKDPFSHLKKD